jgi:hypothetical protein
VAALLVLAEIVVLLAGVVARYVFHAPLVWSDELASILFLWLSMLGAVVALRRGEHMRMTALVSRSSRVHARLFDALAIAASLAFLALVLHPPMNTRSRRGLHRHARAGDQQRLARRGHAGRRGADDAGRLLRLLRVSPPARSSLAVARNYGAAGACLLARAARGVQPLGKLNLVIFFVGVVAVNVFAGVPIAFSFALATFGLSGAHHLDAAAVMVGPHGRGHVAPHPAGGAALRLSGRC